MFYTIYLFGSWKVVGVVVSLKGTLLVLVTLVVVGLEGLGTLVVEGLGPLLKLTRNGDSEF